jgi:hypothetical protein
MSLHSVSDVYIFKGELKFRTETTTKCQFQCLFLFPLLLFMLLTEFLFCIHVSIIDLQVNGFVERAYNNVITSLMETVKFHLVEGLRKAKIYTTHYFWCFG